MKLGWKNVTSVWFFNWVFLVKKLMIYEAAKGGKWPYLHRFTNTKFRFTCGFHYSILFYDRSYYSNVPQALRYPYVCLKRDKSFQYLALEQSTFFIMQNTAQCFKFRLFGVLTIQVDFCFPKLYFSSLIRTQIECIIK